MTKAQLIDELLSLEREVQKEPRVGTPDEPNNLSSPINTEHLGAIIDTAPIAIFISRIADGTVVYCNGGAGDLHGVRPESLIGRNVAEFYACPDERKKLIEELNNSGGFHGREMEIQRWDGTARWVSISGRFIDFAGKPALLSALLDITESKAAQQALIGSEVRFRHLVEGSIEGILVHRDHKPILVNEAWASMHGYSVEEVLAMASVVPLMAPHEQERMVTYKSQRLRGQSAPRRYEYQALHKNGDLLWMENLVSIVTWDGAPAVQSTIIDVTERKHAEEALRHANDALEDRVKERTDELREKEAQLGDAITAISEGFALYDENDRLVLCNDQYRDAFPNLAKVENLIVPGMTFERFVREGAERGLVTAAIGRVEEYVAERMARFHYPTGTFDYSQTRGSWIRSSERKTAQGRTVCIRSDITEFKLAEMALRESERQLRLIVDSLPVLIAYLDADFRFVMINKTGTEWYKRTEEEIIGKHPKDILGFEAKLWRDKRKEALHGKEITYETTINFPDGAKRETRVIYVPNISENGNVDGMFVLNEDVTQIKLVQEQLRRSQKLEAVGQVTGGVAHEFNNLLMVITGNLELLLEDDMQDLEETRAVAERVLKSAFRGKDLTSRLLSYTGNPFNRPEIIDVGQAVLGTTELLQPLLGETIKVLTEIPNNLWRSNIDPSEFENALTNLAINARDAMREGGELTITCANTTLDDVFARNRPYSVKTGDYVSVAVRDNGTGMRPGVVDQAFDPFYTTKDVGKGAGLGLSMVYGFVHRQSGGYIDIATKEGRGTTVTLYFPRSTPVNEKRKADGSNNALAHDRPVILLVEDDADLRHMLVRTIKSSDYNVIQAVDAISALSMLDPSQEIDLLLSDVVLPGGMSGIDLAEKVQANQPNAKIILISGYAKEELVAKGIPENRYPLLSKPFRRRELTAALEAAFAD